MTGAHAEVSESFVHVRWPLEELPELPVEFGWTFGTVFTLGADVLVDDICQDGSQVPFSAA